MGAGTANGVHGGHGALLPSTGSGSTPFTGSASGYSEDLHVMPGCAVLPRRLTLWEEEEDSLCCDTNLYVPSCRGVVEGLQLALKSALSSGTSWFKRGCSRKKVQPHVAVRPSAPAAAGAGKRTVKV